MDVALEDVAEHGAGLVIGTEDLGGLSQPDQFCDSGSAQVPARRGHRGDLGSAPGTGTGAEGTASGWAGQAQGGHSRNFPMERGIRGWKCPGRVGSHPWRCHLGVALRALGIRTLILEGFSSLRDPRVLFYSRIMSCSVTGQSEMPGSPHTAWAPVPLITPEHKMQSLSQQEDFLTPGWVWP